ncbi:MAG TPA: cytochrome P450 [Actinomycetota bacterium]|nr:cytochrome P450 [Actinomycetota bacterium]
MSIDTLATRFAPSDLGFIADPYEVYAALREHAPVLHHEETDHWLVSRFADVNALLRDRRFGRTYLHLASHAEMGHPDDRPGTEAFWHLIRNGILDMEPPDHTRVRRLVAKAFTPKMVGSLRAPIARRTAELVDAVRGAGEFDLIREIAEPLPVWVIAELLGVPERDRGHLRPWSADICRMYELAPSDEDVRIASAASIEFSGYLRDLSRARRAHPTGDLISELALVVDEGERLTEDELIGTCVLLLNAGHEATVNVTGNGWWALFRNEDQLARLRADRSLVPTAIEELMRFDTPLQMFERWVLEDVEVEGVRIPRGAELGLLFGSANRDPSAFRDPDVLDVARTPNPHVTFGAGIHFCLGAPLARVELEASFSTVLDRLPDLELVDEPRWKRNYIIRGLEELRVRA